MGHVLLKLVDVIQKLFNRYYKLNLIINVLKKAGGKITSRGVDE